MNLWAVGRSAGGDLVRFLACDRCGGRAVALQGVEGQPTCMACMEGDDPYHRFVCSVDGCGGTPRYMAMIKRGDSPWVLLCQRHLEEDEGHVMSFLGVPQWLIEVDAFDTNDGALMLDLERDLDEVGFTAIIDVEPPRRVNP